MYVLNFLLDYRCVTLFLILSFIDQMLMIIHNNLHFDYMIFN